VNPTAPQTTNSRPFSEDGLRVSPAGSTGHLGSKICNLSGSQGLSCLLSLVRFSVSLLVVDYRHGNHKQSNKRYQRDF
jgi:hypothetical protein